MCDFKHFIGGPTFANKKDTRLYLLREQYKTWSLLEFLTIQASWSAQTFGPGDRTMGLVDHIKKELRELLQEHETDKEAALVETIDVVILALDCAWRLGFAPEEIVHALQTKFDKNVHRKWPDWRKVPHDQAIEHVKPIIIADLTLDEPQPSPLSAMVVGMAAASSPICEGSPSSSDSSSSCDSSSSSSSDFSGGGGDSGGAGASSDF